MEKARTSFFWWLLVMMFPAIMFAGEPVATTTVSGGTITWTPVISDYDSLHLTVVAPDGNVTVQDFALGKSPAFTLGSGAASGPYTYELRVAPHVSASVHAALQAAREADDDAASRKILRDNGIVPVTQSGTLTAQNGSFLSPNVQESGNGAKIASKAAAAPAESVIRLKPGTLDNVIADDLIVQGSACVGVDCVNGESFGFDTIRLKENNDRVRFDDTSSAAGFANRDWQLTANDATNGGANKFSIEDVTGSMVPFTIIAGAITNSLFIDSIGRIGVGTGTPALDMQPTNLDTPTIRLDQPSGAFAAQTWDVAGNEVNFFVRDATHGSLLPFRIRPNAPTSSIDIAANGNVGIGTSTPGTKLDVVSSAVTATVSRTLASNASGIAIVRVAQGTGTTSQRQAYVEHVADESTDVVWRTGMQGTVDYRISDWTGGSELNRVTIAGTTGNIGIGGVTSPTNPLQHSNGAFLSSVGIWTNGSSRDLKEDICDLDAQAAQETLQQLAPVTFRYKIAPQHPHVGFIAEDVPEMVATEGRKGLSPMDIVAVLTKVVQEQQRTIEELSARVEQLEKSGRR